MKRSGMRDGRPRMALRLSRPRRSLSVHEERIERAASGRSIRYARVKPVCCRGCRCGQFVAHIGAKRKCGRAIPDFRCGRVSTEDYSPVLLTEPDMRARIRLFGSIDQNASDSWGDTCGWLISFQRAVSEAIRPVNQDGG